MLRGKQRKGLLCLFLAAIMVIGVLFPGQRAEAATKLKVHFIDVGQADCILIQSDGKNMLVDAGNQEDGKAVVSYLKKQKVKTLDYVIVTHPHEDHIGGMAEVITAFSVKKVFMPDVAATTKTFENFLDTMAEKGLQYQVPKLGKKYKLGKATFTVVAPAGTYGEAELNNWSIGIRVVYKKNSFLLYGDGEEAAEKDMLAAGNTLQAQVLKISHHGSDTATSGALLKKVKPTYVVISCGKDNSYGFPHEEVMKRIKKYKMFRTDLQGTIVATCTGSKITFNHKPSKDYSGGKEEVSKEPVISQLEDVVHITATGKKYHLAGCSSLRKSDQEISLEEAKKQGYTPCSLCHPPQ